MAKAKKRTTKLGPATKSDIKKLERKVNERATHRDLELWGGQLQHQIGEVRQDMKDMEQRLTTAIPQQIMKLLDERIEAYTEHKAEELLGVTGDEVKLIQDKQADHEARLSKVEKVVGVR